MTAAIITLAAIGLFWTTICRFIRTNKSTRREIRWSLAALATTSLGVAWAAWLNPAQLDGAVALLMLSIFAVQVTTSRIWRGGVPSEYTE